MVLYSKAGIALMALTLAWVSFTLLVVARMERSFQRTTPRFQQTVAQEGTQGQLLTRPRSTPTHAPPRDTHEHKGPLCLGPVDVVFTWVNGSDPEQIARLEKFHGNARRLTIMYRDYGTLRFAMRSIEANAPWARTIFLLTNGQKPFWYNASAPRFANEKDTHSTQHAATPDLMLISHTVVADRTKFVTHEQVFVDLNNLPTFNSNAIESNLHRIPGVGECFLFMNDDFFLVDPTPLDYFIDSKTGLLNLHFEGRTAPAEEEMKHNGWFRSVANSNELINTWYHPDANETVRHHFASHHCYFMSKRVLSAMAARWPERWAFSEKNRFRNDHDVAMPFLHTNVALEEGLGHSAPARNVGGAWRSNHTDNVRTWRAITSKRRKPVYCSCLQDRLDPDGPNTDREIDFLEHVMCQLFPNPSSVERTDVPNPCDRWRGKVPQL